MQRGISARRESEELADLRGERHDVVILGVIPKRATLPRRGARLAPPVGLTKA